MCENNSFPYGLCTLLRVYYTAVKLKEGKKGLKASRAIRVTSQVSDFQDLASVSRLLTPVCLEAFAPQPVLPTPQADISNRSQHFSDKPG